MDEGFNETLTLHKLGLYQQLGTSFKTTNIVENMNRLVETKVSRICHWKNSSQRQRWLATVLLTVEPKLRTVKGYRYLPMLREAMKKKNQEKQRVELQKAA